MRTRGQRNVREGTFPGSPSTWTDRPERSSSLSRHTGCSCTSSYRAPAKGPCRPSKTRACISCRSCGYKRTSCGGWERDVRNDKDWEKEGTNLQPPFFSIVEWHLSHSFVFAEIQFDVSESSEHFLSQTLATLQTTGRWFAASPQL
jgi:hypothetical protein